MRGFFDADGRRLRSVGITCALCHSNVDDSFAPGIGARRDGWAARDLDVGAIIAFAPSVQPFVDLLGLVDPSIDAPTVRKVLRSWGPGKFDAELLLDGKAFRPDGKSAATLIPPAFGLAGVNLHTWTGWGSVTHWNGFVANLEMQGQRHLLRSAPERRGEIPDRRRWPVSATCATIPISSRRSSRRCMCTSSACQAPRAAARSASTRRQLQRGKALFEGKADCARCHVPPLFTEPGWNMHTPEEIGIDAFQAERSPDGHYRTAPLKGLWTHAKGGYYHDGRFATLGDVVAHYDRDFALGLSAARTTRPRRIPEIALMPARASRPESGINPLDDERMARPFARIDILTRLSLRPSRVRNVTSTVTVPFSASPKCTGTTLCDP